MAIQNHRITRRIAAALLSFIAVFAVMRALSSSSSPPAVVAGSGEVARAGLLPGATTEQRIGSLQAQIRGGADGAENYADLGLSYLQRVRETGDPTLYAKAEGVLRRALRPAVSGRLHSRATTSARASP